MTDRTNFEVLLDLLADECDGQAPVFRGAGDGERTVDPDHRRRVVRHLQEDRTAQLTLFLLAREMTADGAGSPALHRRSIVEFATAVQDRFDIDLLRVAREHNELLPGGLTDDQVSDLSSAGGD